MVTEKAAFEDMRDKGFVQNDCSYAGHSLGEYSALASVADVLPISSLVDVVFYRGITMQRAVERDASGRSNYAMCAVNPSRISADFTDAALREVVDTISTLTNTLLEIVNYNVEVWFLPNNLLHDLILPKGPTICLCWRACRFANYDQRLELLQSPENRHRQGIYCSLLN